MQIIRSTSNEKYKYIKSLSLKKNRIKYREYTVEGIKSVHDAIKSNKTVSAIVVSEAFYNGENFRYPENADFFVFENGIFGKLCDTLTPQGIIGVIKMEEKTTEPDLDKPYVYCDSVTDPGNMGTIIRTADAAGFGGVILSEGCVDIYSPKTVRASMGSFFNIDVITDKNGEYLKALKKRGFNLFGGSLGENTVSYTKADFTKPSVIVVGNEANGIRDDIIKLCTPVKIPILGRAESLNVSVAAGILIYELIRQRS